MSVSASPTSAGTLHPIDAPGSLPGDKGGLCLRWSAVARFHVATITPTKAELIAQWAPTRPWGPAADVPIDVIGSYRFDDPDGRVGMETHLVTAGGMLLQIPLTYRDERLDGADDALIVEMQHSVLGTRWVYDGLRDPRFVVMLAAVAMTGQGEALGMAVYEGRWYISPSNVRIQGGGWTHEPVAVDGFEVGRDDATVVVLRNERFELTVFRRPVPGPRPPIGLTATWDGQPNPVVLAEVTERSR
jgi:Maltokinase N-terminal cap domain